MPNSAMFFSLFLQGATQLLNCASKQCGRSSRRHGRDSDDRFSNWSFLLPAALDRGQLEKWNLHRCRTMDLYKALLRLRPSCAHRLYVDKILKVVTPADLPMEQPTKFLFSVTPREQKA